jgi:hypothetical protein
MKAISYYPWSNDMPSRNDTPGELVPMGVPSNRRYKTELRVTYTFDGYGNSEVVILAEAVRTPWHEHLIEAPMTDDYWKLTDDQQF